MDGSTAYPKDKPGNGVRCMPAGWGDDVAALHALIDRTGKKDPTVEWAVHPMFGPLSGQEWGLLCWKHLDHHLRPFGA